MGQSDLDGLILHKTLFYIVKFHPCILLLLCFIVLTNPTFNESKIEMKNQNSYSWPTHNWNKTLMMMMIFFKEKAHFRGKYMLGNAEIRVPSMIDTLACTVKHMGTYQVCKILCRNPTHIEFKANLWTITGFSILHHCFLLNGYFLFLIFCRYFTSNQNG